MRRRYVSTLTCMLVAVAWLWVGCKPSVPSEFISEDDMEDILYDYHLADAMAQLDNDSYATSLTTYRTAVLEKHGVSQAQFDTSMVYYMRHTERLHAIYKRISERLEDRARHLGSSEGSLASITGSTASGDTADIWKGDLSLALIPSHPFNSYSFAYKADSAFRKGDTFILTFHSDFIFQDGVREGIAVLAVVYKNDSVGTQMQRMSSSSQIQVRVDDRDTLGIKEVKGYFLLNRNAQNSSTTTLQLMSVSNIHLYRCHRPKDSKPTLQLGDKLPVDSTAPRTATVPVAASQPGSDSPHKASRPRP